MLTKQLKVFSEAILIGLFLVACSPVIESVSTATQTATPDRPSNTHIWEAAPTLIQFSITGESPAPFGVSGTPGLLLYADGRLIIAKDRQFQESRLSREETCRLLNTFEQLGFFDLDLSDYERELAKYVQGVVSTTIIEVNAWRSRHEAISALWEVMGDTQVNVPQALRAIYQLLTTYRPADLQLYQFDQLAVAIYKYPNSPNAYRAKQTWALASPSLKELYAQANVKNRSQGLGLAIKGETAQAVYREVLRTTDSYFLEDGETYFIAARPLLPYESLESAMAYHATIPSPGVSTNTLKLSCYSSDGIVDTP